MLRRNFSQEAALFLFSFFFYLNVWISIWDGSLVGLNVTPGWAMCVSVAHGGGGETPPRGVAMVIIGFPITVASSSIDYLLLPWQSITKPFNKTTSSKTCLGFNTFFMPRKQGKHAKKTNVLNRFPNRKNKNKLKHFQYFLFLKKRFIAFFFFSHFTMSTS